MALGSNIEPERYLPKAVERLRLLGDVLAVSAVYESPPADESDQPNYLNAAVLLAVPLSAAELCRAAFPAIEAELERVRDPANRNAPRTIDVDLALYDDCILEIDHRRIPDPEIADRAFLAIPLAELEPSHIIPGLGVSLAQVAEPHRTTGSLTRRTDVMLKTAAAKDPVRAQD